MDILNSLNSTLFPGHRVPRVNGWKEAEKYQLPRDCEVILLDQSPESDYIYMKKVDAAGVETFARYKISEEPIPEFNPEKFVTIDDFSKFKEEILNGFDSLKSAITTGRTEPSRNDQQSGGADHEFGKPTGDVSAIVVRK